VVSSLYGVVRDALRAGAPLALATVIERQPGDGPGVGLAPLGAKIAVRPGVDPLGSLGNPDLDSAVARDARGALDAGVTSVRHYGPRGETEEADLTIYIEVMVSPPHLVVFGAVDFTAALVRVAKVLGYVVTVCDARAVFATTQRFPEADEVVVDWPQRYLASVADELGPRDAICVLTHDQKFDVPAIIGALATKVGYIGAMGSRHTHARRLERLREEGVDEAGLARLWAPIGLDIGARTPAETAVAIVAEIIAKRSDAPVTSLRGGSGPIHRRARATAADRSFAVPDLGDRQLKGPTEVG
jgi:xanthine dehydrogenase accessory factor